MRIKQTIKNQFQQQYLALIDESSKTICYVTFKEKSISEIHFNFIAQLIILIFCLIRGGIHRWSIEIGMLLGVSIMKQLPASAYGVYISQLIRYSKACGSYQDFLGRELLLTIKLLNQGFLLVNLVDLYGISVSQMTTYMLHLSQTFPGSFLIHDSSPGL